MNQNKFAKWLKERGLEKSAYKYTDALKNIAQKLSGDQLKDISIFDYTDVSKYDDLKNAIEADESFKVINTKGHNMYSAALTHYKKFLSDDKNIHYEEDNDSSFSQKKDLFLGFQKEWPLEKVRKMSLDKYHRVGKKDTFTYWIEVITDSIGSIWGGSAFKFGVYNRKSDEKKEESKNKSLKYTIDYGWHKKYGATFQEAFSKVRDLIVEVIESVQNNDIAKIDDIDLGEGYKWKIAFHYQDIHNPSVLAIFKKEALDEYVLDDSLSFSEIQKRIKHENNIQKFTDLLKVGREIWAKFESNFSELDRSKKEGIPQKKRLEILNAEENIRKERRILERSRNSQQVNERKDLDGYTCQICSFNFNNKIVEVHHLIPLYTSDDVRITNIEELLTLCPTCHRLAHYILRQDCKKNNIQERDSIFTDKKLLMSELIKIKS
ncbi:MAG: HNH endonuclease [Endomicrobia bacterium]|nr:HNH endonuclease [Endomicrobiia bacterium]